MDGGRMNLAEQDVQKIIEYLEQTLSPFLLILFGSCAKGMMRSDSDVDIAFYSDGEYSPYEVFMTAQELAAVIGRDVDLLDLRKASTVMKAQVVSSGRVIYCTDEVRRMTFFMNSLKEYAVLNEHRDPVLAKIKSRGVGGR